MTAISPAEHGTRYEPPRAAPFQHDDSAAAWNTATLISFRLCFVYFGLIVLTTQMLSSFIPLPYLGIPDLQMSPAVRGLVGWVGRHILGLASVPLARSGSGDKTYDWVQSFSLLLVAVLVTAVWSIRGRDARDHAKLYGWFRLFLRFALGSTMISYGMVKAIPLQMSAPTLTRLLEPYGNFSPMGVLWCVGRRGDGIRDSRRAARSSAGGILLFIPRTALLGALDVPRRHGRRFSRST